MAGMDNPVERAWFTAHIRQPDQVHDPLRCYSLAAEEIETINPNTLNLPAFRWSKDAEVTATIHKAGSVLVRKHTDGRIENPWEVSFKSIFHMANDSGLFLDHQDIAPLICERRGALAVLDDGRKVYPLYEGKMFWHFDHRYGTYEGQTQKQANKGVLPHVNDALHNDPKYRIQPRYWMDAELVRNALGDEADRKWFFSWRDVGPLERTFVGTIIPVTAAGHKAPLLFSQKEPKAIAALTAVLSSLVADYSARQKSNAMTFFVVEQISIIDPESLRQRVAWLGSSPENWLSERVLELCYTNIELAPFAADLGHDQLPFRWQPDRRVLLQSEIDAAVLHLYGLNRSQAEWLLDSFTVLRKYEERDHGEFRTKRVVLETFDAMAKAQRLGQIYKTRLDPPPADPRCCHPPRGEVSHEGRRHLGLRLADQ